MELTFELPDDVGRRLRQLPDPNRFLLELLLRALGNVEAHETSAPPLDSRETEDEWRRANRDYLQSHFVGKWVVLEGEEIVAHSEDAAEAVEDARARGVAAPFVFYVDPPREPGVVRLGL